MIAKHFLQPILNDDRLTCRLGDAEARLLVEWLVEQAERIGGEHWSEELTRRSVARLCRRGRSISHFVHLWCHDEDFGAAFQLAATEKFTWPLPSGRLDPCDLMAAILGWETSCQV